MGLGAGRLKIESPEEMERTDGKFWVSIDGMGYFDSDIGIALEKTLAGYVEMMAEK